MFLWSTQNQRCFNVKFHVDLTLINWRCFDVEIRLSFQRKYKDFNFFNVNIKILIFQASRHNNKIVFRVNPKSTLFQRWILSMNQRWQIDVESTWISGWPTSRRYFNIYQHWINVECLLGKCPKVATWQHCLILLSWS